MSDEIGRFRLEWTTYQEHAETFTLAELRELASQGHDIFYDGEPDLDALGAMNDDGFFAAITTGDTYLRTTWAAMDRADEVDVYGRFLEYGRIPHSRPERGPVRSRGRGHARRRCRVPAPRLRADAGPAPPPPRP
jgi:hypothetical protein